MCLYQIDLDDEKCEVYLYPGDVGSTVNFINLKDVVRDTIQETSTSWHSPTINFVKLKGMIYRVVSVILWKYNEVLEFCEIICIYVSNNVKYIPCKHLKVIEYKPIFNAFAYFRTEEEFCSRVTALK